MVIALAHTTLYPTTKPENIFFTASWRLVLGDFGVAINVSKERPVTRTGTGELAVHQMGKAVREAQSAVMATTLELAPCSDAADCVGAKKAGPCMLLRAFAIALS